MFADTGTTSSDATTPDDWSLRESRIDLSAIRSNTARLREVSETSHLIAVVKANAYGHGAVPVARAVIESGAAQLGVTSIAEALELRAGGIDAPILSWQHEHYTDFAPAIANRIELGVGTVAQLERVLLAARAQATTAVLHLKVETGLARNGVAARDWDALFTLAGRAESEQSAHIRGLWSHLANAGEAADRLAAEHLNDAVRCARRHGIVPDLVHLASSAASLTRPALGFDAVRSGIALYGLQPEPYIDMHALGFRPAMTFRARVVAVRRVKAGTGVSYGHHGRTTRTSTLALIAAGYADGIPRSASGTASVSINGRGHPIIGRVAMDQTIVDVRDAPVKEGDTAVIFGEPAFGHPGCDEFAGECQTIGYEIVTRVGARVPRVFLP